MARRAARGCLQVNVKLGGDNASLVGDVPSWCPAVSQ